MHGFAKILFAIFINTESAVDAAFSFVFYSCPARAFVLGVVGKGSPSSPG